MRSSSRSGSVGQRAASLGVGVVAILLCIGALLVVRPMLVARFGTLRATADTYALPAPEQVVVASLGYRSAVADLIFAHVLVSYGLHFEQRRRFEFAGNYLDTINALDPSFRMPFYVADTLLTLQPVKPRAVDVIKAREILERGMDEHPYDSRLWLQAAQFIAYLGPTHFDDPEVRREWRHEGTRRLARACEILSEDESMPHKCIVAAGMLSREGEIEAMVDFLERVLSVTDNEEVRALALATLSQKAGERERVRVEQRHRVFRELWAQDLSFVSKDALLVLGPPLSAGRCAGAARDEDACATTWQAWAEARSRDSGR